MEEEKTYSLSIFLHKDSVDNFDECIKEETLEDGNSKDYNVNRETIGAEGKVYVSNSDTSTPKWEEDINKFTLDDIELVESATNRAVVTLKIERRFMSITFGYGRYMIDDNTIISDFGVKVAANLVDSNQIKSLNTMNIEDVVIDIQKQSSTFSNQEQLQINTLQEILKEIAGTPNRRSGDAAPKYLVGTDSLRATKKMNLANIVEDLKYYKNIYNEETYLNKGFAWIDNIKRVKDKKAIQGLDQHLAKSIIDEEGHIHISANRPLDWSNLEGFFLTGMNKRVENYSVDLDINYEEYFAYIRSESSDTDIVGKVKRDELQVLYAQSGNIVTLSNIYNSIIFEDEVDDLEEVSNGRYLLTHGEWFKLDTEYYAEILDEFYNIEIEEKVEFIDYDENKAEETENGKYHEEHYNIDLAKSNPDYILFDQNNFQADVPGNNPIEPCDVFTRNKELIHVKRYNGSSSLSHLLAQGIVSASLLSNIEFRNFINLNAEDDIISSDDNNQDFKIVYAIVHKDREKSIHEILPFFTIINLTQTVRQLDLMQIKYTIKKIDVIPKRQD